MSRFLVFVLLTAMTALGTEITTPTGPSNQTQLATFNKDVLPVLQKNCQTCHRVRRRSADVLHVLRKHASLGQGDQGRRAQQEDAALVCRSPCW